MSRASSTVVTKTLPSHLVPVQATLAIESKATSSLGSFTTQMITSLLKYCPINRRSCAP